MTEEWFEERLREADEFNPETKSTKQILEEHLEDTDVSTAQKTTINQKIKEELADKFQNAVGTVKARDVPLEALKRHPDRDSGVLVKTTQGLIDLAEITGAFEGKGGTIMLQGDKGKMLGAVEK